MTDWLIEAARRKVPERKQSAEPEGWCGNRSPITGECMLGCRFFGDCKRGRDPGQQRAAAPELPDGLYIPSGGFLAHFDCRVCGASTQWEGENDEFVLGDAGNVCGGSPRCCP